MTSNVYAYEPDYAVHPGEYLEEVLESREIKKKELAERLNISEKHVSQIINRQAGVTSEIAVHLEKILGISANIWNHMNADYSLFEARKNEELKRKDHLDWLKGFPLASLQNLGFIPKTKDKMELLDSLLYFFAVPGVTEWNKFYKAKAVHFRKSSAFSDDEKHTWAWIRSGEKLAESLETPPYNKEEFKSALIKIRSLSLKSYNKYIPEMIKICQQSGVALVFLPEFKNTHISGVTYWINSNKPMILMSNRYKTNDHFWFTFFHEVGHLLLHGKKEIFIDTDKRKGSGKEEEADRFSRNLLISEKEYSQFVFGKNAMSRMDISAFAKKLKIHPAIVVGRLQHDKHVEFHFHNGFKEKIEIGIEG